MTTWHSVVKISVVILPLQKNGAWWYCHLLLKRTTSCDCSLPLFKMCIHFFSRCCQEPWTQIRSGNLEEIQSIYSCELLVNPEKVDKTGWNVFQNHSLLYKHSLTDAFGWEQFHSFVVETSYLYVIHTYTLVYLEDQKSWACINFQNQII